MPVRPEDVLPDGVDTTIINGTVIRKGSVAAFLANADTLENPAASEQQKQEALAALKELAPAVVLVGLHKHVVFKNEVLEKMLVEAELSYN